MCTIVYKKRIVPLSSTLRSTFARIRSDLPAFNFVCNFIYGDPSVRVDVEHPRDEASVF
jgi:hypothetical protein